MARSHRGDFLRKSIKKIQIIFLSEIFSLRTGAGFDFNFFYSSYDPRKANELEDSNRFRRCCHTQ